MASDSYKSFATSSLLLKPEEVGFFDLPKILFSPNLEQSKFVEISESVEEEISLNDLSSLTESLYLRPKHSTSSLLLKSEEVNSFDVPKILFSPNLHHSKFVESSESVKDEIGLISLSSHTDQSLSLHPKRSSVSLHLRWLIFISILAQKFLHIVAKPLSYIGSILELWLNLVSSNHNIFVLVFNILRGKEVVPHKTSANFCSITTILDKRVELDGSIKHNDPKYNAALSVMAAKASYENVAYIETAVKDHWKMEFLGSHDYWNEYQGKATTQAFILLDRSEDQDTYVVAFRGTEPFNADAWSSDFDISWYGIPGLGKIHGGFMKALGLQKNKGWPKEITIKDDRHPPVAYYAIREILREALSRNDKAKFILTGHSLGGALAILFTAILFYHEETLLLERLDEVYTFGQPRVGDETFATYMEHKLRDNGIRYYRYVYSNDVVPRLPFDDNSSMFKHFGTCLYHNRRYEEKINVEEPNRNYFYPLMAIPMRVNALFELLRSFTIGWENGADFDEGWLLIAFRILGLVFPGLPAHFTQDYVNATRLGSGDVFIYTNYVENE